MTNAELIELHRTLLIFGGLALFGILFYARRAIGWSREDRRKRKRGE